MPSAFKPCKALNVEMGIKPFLLVLQAHHIPQTQPPQYQATRGTRCHLSHHIPLRPPAVPVCITCGRMEAPRVARTQAPTTEKNFPSYPQPLQLLLKTQTLGAFLSPWRQVPGMGFQVRGAFTPGCQPHVLAGHTWDSMQYFLNTQTPADVCHWSSDYSFPSTHWHDRL